MSKAEDRALEAYPIVMSQYSDNCKEYDSNESDRLTFIEGYHQAEKDLELTWEDISKIISIDQQVCGTMGISDYTHNHQQAMEEILKRFKEKK